MVSGGSQLLLAEEGVGRFSTVLQSVDREKRLPATTPAKDLIAATEIDYRKYRREIKRLRDEHPLFEVRPDISMADFEDYVAEALLLSAMLQKTAAARAGALFSAGRTAYYPVRLLLGLVHSGNEKSHPVLRPGDGRISL